MEFLGKGADRLREQREGIHPDRDLSEFRPENVAGHTDKVAPLDELVEEVERFVPEVGLSNVELILLFSSPRSAKIVLPWLRMM